MKKINTSKLTAMGIERAKAACIIHAEKALKYQHQPGKHHLFERHLNLLDQCARVGRTLKGITTNSTLAIEAISSLG